MNYFVQLVETGQTVNLAHITTVNWQEVPDDFEGTGCTATITLSNGCYSCITPADAQTLWEALSRYNTRFGYALSALPQIVKALAALVDGVGMDGVSSSSGGSGEVASNNQPSATATTPASPPAPAPYPQPGQTVAAPAGMGQSQGGNRGKVSSSSGGGRGN